MADGISRHITATDLYLARRSGVWGIRISQCRFIAYFEDRVSVLKPWRADCVMYCQWQLINDVW